jgi:hypothetical protein
MPKRKIDFGSRISGLGFDLRHEPIAAPRQGLDESRRRGPITERRANLVDAGRQARIEVDVRVVAPDLALYFLARDDFSSVLGQRDQHAQRLTGQWQELPCPPQFARRWVEFKGTEPDHARQNTSNSGLFRAI